MLANGARISERYRVEAHLGSGTGGAVYRAFDELAGAAVALKTLDRPVETEFSILAGLYYPGLSVVFDLGADRGLHYFTSELIDGEPLARWAAGRAFDEVRVALADVVVALHGLHRLGFRHNDVKADNVLVRNGRGTLVDLGIVGPRLTAPGDPIGGTPGSIAPELLEGKAGDERADWFGFGVLLGEVSARARGAVPAQIGALAERLREPDPARRPREAIEIASALVSSTELPPIPLATRIFGRDRELALAASALDGGPRILCARSEPGVGASRLLREWKWIAQRRARVVEGSITRPNAVAELLGRAAGRAVRGVSDVIAVRSALVSGEATLTRSGTGSAKPSDGEWGPGESHSLGRGGAASSKTTVLVLDDAHRLPASESELLQAMMRVLAPGDPISIFVATHGSESYADLGATAVELAPFDLESTRAWLSGRVPEREIEPIFTRTGGVPADVQAIVEQRDGLRFEADVLDRFRALGEIERHALAVVAFAGTTPERPVHARLVGPWLTRTAFGVELRRSGDRERIRRASAAEAARSAAREAAELLAAYPERAPDRISLLVAAGLAGEARALARASWSEIAARPIPFRAALAALAADSSDEAFVTELAALLEDAGDPSGALHALAELRKKIEPSSAFYVRAASAALKLSRARTALRHAARARGPGGVLGARLADIVARAWIQAGDARRADEIASDVLAGSRELPFDVVALLEETRAVAKSYLGDVAAAKLGLERAEVLGADRTSPRVRSRIASFRGTLAFRTGDLAGADTAYRKAHALAEAHDLADHLVIAAQNRGTVSHRLGDFGDALASYDEALALARALGKHRTEVTARYNRTQLRCDLGLFERTRIEASELEERARSLGIEIFVALARMVRGEAALHAGDLVNAERDFDACRSMLSKAAARRELGDLELLAAELHLRSNRIDDAAAALERARAELAAADAADIQTRESLLRARLALARGDAKAAVSLLAHAAKRARASGERDLEAEIEALAAEASAAQRAHDAAARHARTARELWDECAATIDVSLRDAFFVHPRRRMAERFEALPERANGARERLLERLLSINARLNASLDVRAILEAAMDAAIEITEAERGFVILAGTAGLEVAVSRNIDRERVDRDYLKFSRTIAERVIETGEPMITTDAFSDSRFAEQRSIQSMRLRSVVGVPIRGRDRVLGALYLDNRFAPGRFAETQVRELLGFADQVAIALGNARLVRELEERTRELETERARIHSNLETKTLEVDRLHREIALTRRALGDRFGRGTILGRSAAMRALFEALDRVADTKMTVLISGESGSGKELVARAIHAGATTPFVGINCAALPENLLESELFGHVRGAFTGADRDRDGLFLLAGEGTLFLDEIGELALGMQAKLLRALQEREIRPVGSAKSIPVAARIVCATNRDLRAEVAAGRFREDLYYRIAVMELRVPPLRDRVDDLPELAAHILAQAAAETGASEPKRLHPDALRVLSRHRWPGNVRELENALRRAHVMSPRTEIGPSDIALESAPDAPSSYADFERREAAELAALLEASRWNVAEVARRAGMSRTTLYRKLRQYNLERKGATPG